MSAKLRGRVRKLEQARGGGIVATACFLFEENEDEKLAAYREYRKSHPHPTADSPVYAFDLCSAEFAAKLDAIDEEERAGQ